MDIVANAIHYVKLEDVIPAHIKKCNSVEFQQKLAWLIAKEKPVDGGTIQSALFKALLEIAKLENACEF